MNIVKKAIIFVLTIAVICTMTGLSDVSSALAATSGDYEYTDNGDGTCTITRYIGAGGDITIPGTLGGLTVTEIGDQAFFGCDSLTTVIIPDCVNRIEEAAFYDCINIVQVAIPASVTSIGDYAFCRCIGLNDVVIPDGVTNIGYQTFYDCKSLNSVIIPNSVTDIKSEAFCGCNRLTSVTIPDSVTSIGAYSFKLCNCITNITIPASVEDIGYGPFACSSNLSEITVAGDNIYFNSVDGVLFNNAETELIQYPIGNTRTSYVIPDSVGNIGSEAFRGCLNLSNVTIPNSVTSISWYAFMECNNLSNVIIPDRVISIGKGAFMECNSLSNITIPHSVTDIKAAVFACCSNLTEINVEEGNTNYISIEGVLFNNLGTELIQYPIGREQTFYIIPDGVTIVKGLAFYCCGSLDSVTIPYSVTDIESPAFAGCGSLCEIAVSEYNAHFKSIDGVLFNKSGTELIQYPIGKDQTSYTILNGVISIENEAFSYCSILTNASIPDCVTRIEQFAFRNCSNLTKITIPSSVTYIGYGAFTDSPNVVIYCERGSVSQTYAIDNNIPYVIDTLSEGVLTRTYVNSEDVTEMIYVYFGADDTTGIYKVTYYVEGEAQLDLEFDGEGNISGVDTNSDGTTDMLDLVAVAQRYMETDFIYDLNADEIINLFDLIIIARQIN